ncbi:MAG: hypothetical protein OQJ77_06595 [Thiovulaceae bacterium]|nr:hypothetical protein [Sulfurimonadaceae bacterium]MCW9026969.1 hypothetical protein [Sulfurimonadaceae bacterium]
MSLSIILFAGFILSVIFHFIGVYANAKKTVWIMVVLMWAAGINMAMSEIKPKGYEDLKKIQGQYADTDALIEEAGEEISLYEMLRIMQSYQKNNPKR